MATTAGSAEVAAAPAEEISPRCPEADLVVTGEVTDLYWWKRDSTVVERHGGGNFGRTGVDALEDVLTVTNSCGEFVATLRVGKVLVGDYPQRELKVRGSLGEWCGGFFQPLDHASHLLWLKFDESGSRVLRSSAYPLFETADGRQAVHYESAFALGLDSLSVPLELEYSKALVASHWWLQEQDFLAGEPPPPGTKFLSQEQLLAEGILRYEGEQLVFGHGVLLEEIVSRLGARVCLEQAEEAATEEGA